MLPIESDFFLLLFHLRVIEVRFGKENAGLYHLLHFSSMGLEVLMRNASIVLLCGKLGWIPFLDLSNGVHTCRRCVSVLMLCFDMSH